MDIPKTVDTDNKKNTKLETVSIAEPLQNRQHAPPNAVNTREQGKEGGRVQFSSVQFSNFYSGLSDKHHHKDHCSVKCTSR